VELSLPRGVDDVEPDEYDLYAKVRTAFEEVARVYNFRLMEPASLEHIATLRAKSGEEIDKEIYAFKDKGGRDIGLRFDLTVGITRYVCSRKDLRLPVKLGASGGIWRYDEPQYGRYRWSHQWDLEIYGPPSVEADAEVIDASSAILKLVGLSNVTIKVGDRRLVEEFIRTRIGITEEKRLVDLMRALDKVEKKTVQELGTEYAAKGFERSQLDSLMEFGRLRGKPSDILSKASELRLAAARELEALLDMLDSRGLKNVEYNMSVVRGIDYYSGIVFEAVDNKNPRLGSLFGGGRYDTLPRLFGRPDLSATGAAGGMERMVLSLSGQRGEPGLLVYVALAGKGAQAQVLRVQKELRENGIPSEAALQPKALSRQLQDASRLGASWTVIVGEKELASKSVTLRDMKSRKEMLLPLPEAIRRMKQS
jgi:histidyl-tRNA synthetase